MDASLIFLGIWGIRGVFVLRPCWLAGGAWIARANERMPNAGGGEDDDA